MFSGLVFGFCFAASIGLYFIRFLKEARASD
jgi:hypothetical protein